MTFQEWSKRDDYVKLWEKTWQEPHMRAGLTALIHLGIPQVSILTPTATNNESINIRALAHSRTEGWFAAVKAIELLKTPTNEQQELPSPWEDATR